MKKLTALLLLLLASGCGEIDSVMKSAFVGPLALPATITFTGGAWDNPNSYVPVRLPDGNDILAIAAHFVLPPDGVLIVADINGSTNSTFTNYGNVFINNIYSKQQSFIIHQRDGVMFIAGLIDDDTPTGPAIFNIYGGTVYCNNYDHLTKYISGGQMFPTDHILGDLNADNKVDFFDYAIFSGDWLEGY